MSGFSAEKQELLNDFISAVQRRPYAVAQLEEPYHYYRRESENGVIDFKVGRGEDGDPIIEEIEWDSRELDTDTEWAVIDVMFAADELTFPEFVAVVRQQAKASLRDSDPFVDSDGDFLRGNPNDTAKARDGEYNTLGREFIDETSVEPNPSFWSDQPE